MYKRQGFNAANLSYFDAIALVLAYTEQTRAMTGAPTPRLNALEAVVPTLATTAALTALTARVAALEALTPRVATVPVNSLILGIASATQTATWNKPLPNTQYQIQTSQVSGAANGVKVLILTQTTTGCTFTVTAGLLGGPATINLVAIPY